MNIVETLRGEEEKLTKQLAAIRGAIAALNGSSTSPLQRRGNRPAGGRPKRSMPAAVRARIAKKARERWAKIRAEKAKATKK